MQILQSETWQTNKAVSKSRHILHFGAVFSTEVKSDKPATAHWQLVWSSIGLRGLPLMLTRSDISTAVGTGDTIDIV